MSEAQERKRRLWWLMWIGQSRFKFTRAEGPCWKGEIQIGRLLFGWQREVNRG